VNLPTLATLLVSIAFIGLCAWVLLPSNKARIEKYGQIPFEDDPQPPRGNGHTR
jgi:cbb3-type cytochrome oxidase subunit 3